MRGWSHEKVYSIFTGDTGTGSAAGFRARAGESRAAPGERDSAYGVGFFPFNQGTEDGGAGNDVPEDIDTYATAYLWNEVLAPANILQIIGRFIHLEIKTEEDWDGRKNKTETLIFPRYHQWDLVTRLVQASREEGPGHKYLAQHSAGSGKSNSIARTAHQLSSLYDDQGEKVFHSVIVVTDRTVLDDQLQDTIYQFEHAEGVVGRINRDKGQGSKSEKLAHALEHGQPIVIVTIQTFPFMLKAIEEGYILDVLRNYRSPHEMPVEWIEARGVNSHQDLVVRGHGLFDVLAKSLHSARRKTR